MNDKETSKDMRIDGTSKSYVDDEFEGGSDSLSIEETESELISLRRSNVRSLLAFRLAL